MSKTKEEILSSKAVYISEGETTGIKSDVLSAMDEYAKQECIEFFLDTTGGYMFKDNAEQLYQQYLSSKTK